MLFRSVTVVYSGGDDVFLLGAWNDTLEAALRIRSAFEAFSCGALTISAGVYLTDEHYPVRLSAAASGELEDLAKEQPEKNAICLFDGTHRYGWNTFQNRVLGEKKSALDTFFSVRGQERGTAYLYKTLDLLRAAQDPKDGKLQLARYAYLLARLEPVRSSPSFGAYRVFADRMYRWALNETDRAELITAIYLYVYENREGNTDGVQQ